ncbi:hypothetical protein L596_014401 [Steinernema carpocapsae]|uniref:Uncharacterized protein n=1 Tax=Steinernema carpocapsae TaxID=34508 RepID=A0A4U5NCM1_STECR|nr:hypothetical protein L596_014401 [Steinernema carpocapsae]
MFSVGSEERARANPTEELKEIQWFARLKLEKFRKTVFYVDIQHILPPLTVARIDSEWKGTLKVDTSFGIYETITLADKKLKELFLSKYRTASSTLKSNCRYVDKSVMFTRFDKPLSGITDTEIVLDCGTSIYVAKTF